LKRPSPNPRFVPVVLEIYEPTDWRRHDLSDDELWILAGMGPTHDLPKMMQERIALLKANETK
jgi:hypothetical protein